MNLFVFFRCEGKKMTSVCRFCLAGNLKLNYLKNNELIKFYETQFHYKFNSEYSRLQAFCSPCYQKLLRCHNVSEIAQKAEKTFCPVSDDGLEVTHENVTDLNLGMERLSPMPFFMNDLVLQDGPISVKEEVLVKVECLSPVNCSISSLSEDSDSERDSLMSHVKQVRPDDSKMKFTCNHCNEVFYVKSAVISHIKSHSRSKLKQKVSHSCKACKKYFIEKRNFVRHMRSHSGEKPFICNLCSKQFADKRNLIHHVRTHTGEKQITCDICNKILTDKRALFRHMRIHTGEKPFGCSVCNTQFNDKRNLVRHMKVHTGVKSYSCSVCHKYFYTKTHVDRHMKIHTGEKPFACVVCTKRFTDKRYLKSHMRVHN